MKNDSNSDLHERRFMTFLLKHTGIALAILIPLAAYSTFSRASTGMSETQAQPKFDSQIVTMSPESVDSVDLKKYSGQWYEIARFPMYFQRNCASDVTATYHLNHDSDGQIKSVDVINQCKKSDGSMMRSEGLAKPANESGSELKVTFLPSWIRWLPVGRADYWILELDEDYKSALVGTPDNKYLWVLSRTPTLSKQTYEQYKNSARKQGYDVSQLKVTTHSGTRNTLVSDSEQVK